jgi:16S rRNA (guanine966-N2)-methyltransferase
VRVITGLAKGRPLKTVKGRDVRPTADRVKGSIFNVIGPRVADADFLDLFAGSGNVGIEALSRGAASCTFVELMTPHLKVVEENLAATGLKDRAELLRRDARAAVQDLGQRRRQFDLIFVDPPYSQELVPQALEGIAAYGLLKPGGWVLCEHHNKDAVPTTVPGAGEAGGLTRFRELVFGETVISLYRKDLVADAPADDTPADGRNMG